jgi:MFS family permease
MLTAATEGRARLFTEDSLPRIGYLELLRRNRSFRCLWSGQIISFLGDWFNIIALYTIVGELSGSGRAIAGVMVAKMLPAFLVTPIAGPLVDRYDRRSLLIAMDVGRALLAIGLILAYRAGSLPALYACLTLMVAMTGIYFPARAAAVPQVTRPEELATANGLAGGTWSVMLAFGAALGGWVTARFGNDVALALDGVTFLVSASFVALVPRLPAPAGHARQSDRTFLAGLKYLAHHPYLLALASLKPLMALGGGIVVLIPIFGTKVFPESGGPEWIGALYSARGLGALFGAVVLIRIFGETNRAMRRTMLGLYLLAAIAYSAMARAPGILGVAAFYLIGGIANGGVWVMSGTLLQREGDPRFLGRIFSLEYGGLMLMAAVSSWGAGVLLDSTALGPRGVAGVYAALFLVPFAVWGAVLLLRALRVGPFGPLPEAEPVEPAVPPAPVGPVVAPEAFEVARAGDEGD